TPEATPPSGVGADGKALALWLISGFQHHTARHATANIRHEDRAPLDYGARAERLAIYEDGFVGTHSYTRDIPGLVAFLDYIPWSDRIYIKYAFVDPARRGRGLARRLIERLYATTSGDIDW